MPIRREGIRDLDAETLMLFAAKGRGGGASVHQAGNANGVKVRRIMQLTADVAGQPFDRLQILDLACGEGVYAIEAALRGAQVLAADARRERMDEGARAARRLGLDNLRFVQEDVRRFQRATHGGFDIIYLLGILYHLDVPDSFRVLENLQAMCRRALLIDTHVSLDPQSEVEYRGKRYCGMHCREHGDKDPAALRQSRQLAAFDTTHAYLFAKESLVRLLVDLGFTSVLECHGPLEANKPLDRVTLVATRGQPVLLSSYPWVNGKSEDQIAATVRALEPHGEPAASGRMLRRMVNGLLRPLGYEIRRAG